MKHLFFLLLLIFNLNLKAQNDTIVYAGRDSVITMENAELYFEITSNRHGYWEKEYYRTKKGWDKKSRHKRFEEVNDSTYTVTTYYQNKEDSTYMLIAIKQESGLYLLKEYYESGALKSTQNSSMIFPFYGNGVKTNYYENGNVKYTGNFLNNKKEGEHSEYFVDGAKKKISILHKDQIISNRSWYQDGTERISNVFNITEVRPEFPKGDAKMYEFLGKKMMYPKEARDQNIQGRVYISFIVMEDGSLEELQILRGIGGGCDEETIRVVKMMPKWLPGLIDNKPVRVRFNLPVVFKLR
jgi:TonB family protein